MKWEYKILERNMNPYVDSSAQIAEKLARFLNELNKLGRDGWEAVAYEAEARGVLLLKRPIAD